MVAKGVVVSTYRKSFKSKFPAYTPVYENNVQYRTNRRSVEHFHSIDPFTWYEESETDSDASGGLNKRPASVPLHKFKHDKFNKAYMEKHQSTTSIEEKNGRIEVVASTTGTSATVHNVTPVSAQKAPSCLAVSQSIGVQTEMKPRDKKQMCNKHDKGMQKSDDDGSYSGPSEPKDESRRLQMVAVDLPVPKRCSSKSTRSKKPVSKPSYSKPVPKPRPMSAPLGRPIKKEQDDPDASTTRPPFVPYGFLDRERATCVKKTHNIRASAEIYPSALRAMRRRQDDIEKREESASLKDKRKKALFNDFNVKMARDTSQWDTEYRSHFVGYDRTEYEHTPMGRRISHRKDGELIASV